MNAGRKQLCTSLLVVMTVVGTSSLSEARQPNPQEQAERILQRSGVKGGLIVHMGCGDGKLTAALRAADGYLVHGLDPDEANVEKARRHIQSLGLYGDVSVERLDDDRLPYVDNLVNLVVSEDLGSISVPEVMRILCPDGVAYIQKNGNWTKTVKARPSQIDEWTHFLYDATNNAVSDDSVVGPPRQLQWVAGPQYARSHDHLASVSAAVSAGGRIFYVVDEGPIAAVVLEPQWKLVARDAFSGVFLWSRQIPKWQWHLRGFRSGPSDMARRLVAAGDRVYVTLQIEGPLSALDAATGRTIRTYEKTQGTLEVIYDDGTLFVVAGAAAEQQNTDKSEGKRPGFVTVRPQRPAYPQKPPRKRISAIDAGTGRVLWSKSGADTHELMPTTLAVSRRRVFFQNADDIICLDAKSGEDLWRAERPVSRRRPTWSAPTLVVYGDVVLSADRAVGQKSQDANGPRKVDWIVSSAGGQAPVGELIAFSAEDGQRLWNCECRECYNAPVDVLVADGLVWTGDLVRAKEPGFTEGRDPRTGRIARTRPQDETFFAPGMGHGRCHRNRATNRFLVLGRSGVEFIDLATGKGIPHHWVRGTCQYGVMPCNGLLYAPPHSCACFITAKLNDFNCLAPARKSQVRTRKPERLEKGPAYEQVFTSDPRPASSDSWPTYRHDAARSGYTPVPISTSLRPAWKTQLGGGLSSIVIAEGKLLVAQVDAHTVHALDAESGRRLWSYVAGGRIDSPPTIWQGRVLFGCAGGWVYCLRSSDGALAWRFRAAPQERRIVAYGQVESLWPIHGSVLVHDDIVYCAAGRSSYLDGGIRLCRLDAKTGRLLSETPLDDRDPQTGYQRKGVVHGTNMPGALPDILSCDGESIYMRHSRFDLTGQPQAPKVPHLFSAAGFLDDTWWHRTYWLVGTAMGSNYGGWPRVGNRVPAGRLLVLDDSFVYGFGRNQYIHHGAHVGIDGATIFHYKPKRDAQRRFTYYQAFAIERESSAGDRQQAKRARQYRWTQQLPVLTRAMVLAGDSLLLAGPPDIFSSDLSRLGRAKTDEPATALEGSKGGLLIVVSAAEGRKLAQYDLDSPPVFDGMAAAHGRAYLATVDGSVVCLCPDK